MGCPNRGTRLEAAAAIEVVGIARVERCRRESRIDLRASPASHLVVANQLVRLRQILGNRLRGPQRQGRDGQRRIPRGDRWENAAADHEQVRVIPGALVFVHYRATRVGSHPVSSDNMSGAKILQARWLSIDVHDE
jgi:hypothetical protein